MQYVELHARSALSFLALPVAVGLNVIITTILVAKTCVWFNDTISKADAYASP